MISLIKRIMQRFLIKSHIVCIMRDFSTLAKSLMTDDGYFNFCVPIRMLLGFCEDYKCVVINARHKLILIARIGNNYIEIQRQSRHLNYSKYNGECLTLNEVNKLHATSLGKWTISKYEFSFLGTVRILPIAEYNKAFLGH